MDWSAGARTILGPSGGSRSSFFSMNGRIETWEEIKLKEVGDHSQHREKILSHLLPYVKLHTHLTSVLWADVLCGVFAQQGRSKGEVHSVHPSKPPSRHVPGMPPQGCPHLSVVTPRPLMAMPPLLHNESAL
uniref:Uncharacterized protein n=1 Tax=Sphaerodactylus townsendi TaxID=933632 RepID=A0ACB8G6R8_9SAUR